jgi:hypothetical protein
MLYSVAKDFLIAAPDDIVFSPHPTETQHTRPTGKQAE